MVLLIYRIKVNIPVIIMGETGCGKTELIINLNQLLNNGKTTVEIININSSITEEILCKVINEKNESAKNNKDYEFWIFFDEMNTCLSLSFLTEIFIKRTYNGNSLSDNIRLIGACNPYRKRRINKEKYGVNISNDNDYELTYLVNPLPQSLLYYVFSFGFIDEYDEKKYIQNIIEELFEKEENYLHKITKEAISQCHIYLRKIFDYSVVSLREISRFSNCYKFLFNYFVIKNNYERKENNIKNNKIRSIICSIYLNYYIRLDDGRKRANFDSLLRPILLKLINNESYEDTGNNLIEQIKNESLKNEIIRENKIINYFSDFLKIEQEYIFHQIEIDKDLWRNSLLKENLFLVFLSLNANIPCIMIGKSGSGKSLSAQIIIKSMRGKYSKKEFFQQFPTIIQIPFQGSELTQPEDVLILFVKAENKISHNKKKYIKLPKSMILFDNLDIAGRSKNNPLKQLHSKLDHIYKEESISFIGTSSDYSLEPTIINRTLVSSVPDLDENLDDLIETSYSIVESISYKLKSEIIFEILSKTYFEYKRILQKIKELVVCKQYVSKYEECDEEQSCDEQQSCDEKSLISDESDKKKKKKKKKKILFEQIKYLEEFKDLLQRENKIRKDFHGCSDFYNLIKGIAVEFVKFEDSINSIIVKYIERNFGGINYEIDINFNLVLGDIEIYMDLIKTILRDYDLYSKNKTVKLSSVFLFKKLYNLECERQGCNHLKIDYIKLNDYNINYSINDNIRNVKSRFLLLKVNSNLSNLIYEAIKLQNPSKEIKIYEGPFEDNNSKEYLFRIIRQIQKDAKDDKIIIIENLNIIHPFLFDLYNMNYIKRGDKKYARIYLDNYNEQLTFVNDNFRIIFLFNRRF